MSSERLLVLHSQLPLLVLHSRLPLLVLHSQLPLKQGFSLARKLRTAPR